VIVVTVALVWMDPCLRHAAVFRWRNGKAALALCLLLQACTLLPERPGPPPAAELPERFAGAAAPGEHQARLWWEAFASPELNRIVAAALASNLDLAQALARLDQARARARIAHSGRLPLLAPLADLSDFDTPSNAGIGAQLEELGLGAGLSESFGVSLPERIGLSTYTLGVEFSWEADFWNRRRDIALAAGAEMAASEADLAAARIAILAETIATWLEISNLRRQLALAEETAELSRLRESLASERYQRGLLGAAPRNALQAMAWQASARVPPLDADLAEARSRLWILLGGFDGELAGLLDAGEAYTIPVAPVAAGVPASLLEQRPDVAAARQRMMAASFELGARRAEMLPVLSLSGSIGLQSADAGDWFDPDQWFSNFSDNLFGPVLQGSRLRDNVERAEARADIATQLCEPQIGAQRLELALAAQARGANDGAPGQDGKAVVTGRCQACHRI